MCWPDGYPVVMPSRPSALRRQRLYARAASRQVERIVAFRRWKSATDTNRRRAFQEGVHLMLANPPWRQLRERAPEDSGRQEARKKNSLTESLRCTVQYRTRTPDGPQN